MSGPTLFDIDFKNKIAWVWTTLKISNEIFLTDKKYPSLIQVIKSMLSSPGVSSTLSGKYTLKNYAEKALLRKCIEMDMLDEL